MHSFIYKKKIVILVIINLNIKCYVHLMNKKYLFSPNNHALVLNYYFIP